MNDNEKSAEMTTDQEFLTAMRIKPDSIPDPYGPDSDWERMDEDSAPAATNCAPCASKDAWIADVQEANRGMARRLENAHRWLFLACVVAVLAFFVGMAVNR